MKSKHKCLYFHFGWLRSGPRAPATSKVKHFVIIVNGLTIVTKSSMLDNTGQKKWVFKVKNEQDSH